MSEIIKRITSVIFDKASKISKNIIWLIGLNIVIGISQFVVYAIINSALGKESLGVWSLVVAASSIGQISSFGFSSSLVRYLPEMLLKNQKASIDKMLGTVNFSNFFFTLPILVLLYFPATQYAAQLLTAKQALVFNAIIPLSLAGLFFNNLFLVYSYLLDAMQKYYLRAIIQISGWVIFLISSIILIPTYGLMGVAISFLIQNIMQFAIVLFVIYSKKIISRSYPISFSKVFFKKIFSFGVKSQYINILVIFFDPLVKYFITKHIGLAGTGNYEFANKIVIQARNLLISTNQVIIPKIIIHKNDGTQNQYFKEVSNRNVILSGAIGLFILLLAPLAVILFSGHYDVVLMQCIIILNIGWVCNMITSVHYFCSIGLDKMGKLVIYHLLLSIITLGLYFLLSRFSQNQSFYYFVPTIALFSGSVYNSYALSKEISSSYRWLQSGVFIYFIFASLILLMLHYIKFNMVSFIAMPLLFSLFILYLLKQYRSGKLL